MPRGGGSSSPCAQRLNAGSSAFADDDDMGGDGKHEQRAFFGRRKGHPLRPQQAAVFATMLPKVTLDLTQPAPVDLRKVFPFPVEEVRLEIGFGSAEHLIAQAIANPRTGVIGSEAL